MDEFHFIRPHFLWLMIPAALLAWASYRRQNAQNSWQKIFDPHLLEHLLVGDHERRRIKPIHVLTVIWIIGILALSGPTWKREPSPFADDQAGLVIVLNISGTMNATDVQPSRLERAKFKIKDLLELREGAATALIVYSGSSHLVMPLTKDDRIINTMLEGLTPSVMPTDGDDLNNALAKAEQLLRDAGSAGSALVITDTVSATQAESISQSELKIPTHFLSIQATEAPLEPGIQQAAKPLSATIQKLTLNDNDIVELNQQAQSNLMTVTDDQNDDRWQDTGYYFLPWIALGSILWSRKGWTSS